MKTLQVSTTHGGGGAPKAASRLHHSLRRAGVDSFLLVQVKTDDDPTVLGPVGNISKMNAMVAPHLDWFPLRFYFGRQDRVWTTGLFNSDTPARIAGLKPDIVNLHWIGKGLLSVKGLSRVSAPLVWTLHDSWAFTGGCHLPIDCPLYRNSCGACPQLSSKRASDLSRWIWTRKKRHWEELELTLVAPSNWMRDCVRASSLLRNSRVEVIPNCLDTEVFRALPQKTARDLIGLPDDKMIILICAMDFAINPLKGSSHLEGVLGRLAETDLRKRAELLVFGTTTVAGIADLGFETHCAGIVHDDLTLALVYSASDLFVTSSVTENLPYTVMEAMACGVPCVGFDVGGMSDLIDHGGTGYLAKPFDIDDMAQGLYWVLQDDSRRQSLSTQARDKAVAKFRSGEIARRYLDLYQELLDKGAVR